MKLFAIVVLLSTTHTLVAQNDSLSDMLWAEAGGYIDLNEDHGGAYEVIDDANNGYLKIAFTEEGCGCYSETVVGAYKDIRGSYSTLKMDWDGCGWRKTLSSNKDLNSILPEAFGLITFIPQAGVNNGPDRSAMLFLEASLPRKGTDTKIELNYVPFGFRFEGDDRILSRSGYEQQQGADRPNFKYQGEFKSAINQLKDETTLQYILNREIEKINSHDKIIIDGLVGEGKSFKSLKFLVARLVLLKLYYQVSKSIEYKSVVLGWDSEKARFYIKEKIKNDMPDLSLLEFIKQLPFLMAVC